MDDNGKNWDKGNTAGLLKGDKKSTKTSWQRDTRKFLIKAHFGKNLPGI